MEPWIDRGPNFQIPNTQCSAVQAFARWGQSCGIARGVVISAGAPSTTRY